MAAPATLSKVKAALFVAPVNPGSAVFPKQAIGFTPVPKTQLPFRSLVVASTNDPYGSVEYGLECSQSWGSRFEVIGPKGHINGASGLGSWEEGFQLLTGLVRG
jgi:predicted alpha/beta hydrolase family esterase